jgi:isopentenyl-diphosphate Delta-isomerase
MLSFEKRKRDHIEISLSAQSQSAVNEGLNSIELIHEALPDFNFSDISIKTKTLKGKQSIDLDSPVFISSMTLGHETSANINHVMAQVCVQKNMLMGVGSQRRQLEDTSAIQECITLRAKYPKLKVMGNLGIAQVIETPVEKIQALVESLEAQAMIVHTNPLQECIQPEGNPDFKGSYQSLENLCQKLSVPVVLKETGCGFSKKTLERLKETGLSAVDVSGRGGTHWGRVEAKRLPQEHVKFPAGQTFADWGISTVESLLAAKELGLQFEIWASGGVRSGLDVAKFLALGSSMVGVAQPMLAAALQGEDELSQYIDGLHYELKVAMFCTGISQLSQFSQGGLWKKI